MTRPHAAIGLLLALAVTFCPLFGSGVLLHEHGPHDSHIHHIADMAASDPARLALWHSNSHGPCPQDHDDHAWGCNDFGDEGLLIATVEEAAVHKGRSCLVTSVLSACVSQPPAVLPKPDPLMLKRVLCMAMAGASPPRTCMENILLSNHAILI